MITIRLQAFLGLALLLLAFSANAFVEFSRISVVPPPPTDQRVLFDKPTTVTDEESVGAKKDIAKFSKNVRRSSNTPPEGAIATPKTEASQIKKGPTRPGGAPAAASGDMLDSKSWLNNLLQDEGIVLGKEKKEVEVSDGGTKLSEVLATKGEWSAYFDSESTGLVYYFNSFTGESQWKPPSPTFPTVSMTKEMKEISKQKQEEFEQIEKASQVDQTPLATFLSWEAFWDEEDTGYVYYHNTATGTTQWTPPKFFPQIQLKEGMKVVSKPDLQDKNLAKPDLQDKNLATDGDWNAYFDVESALVYFFNRLSGKSQWDKPTATFPQVQLTESMQETVCAKDDVLKRKRRGPLAGLIGAIFGRKSHEMRHKNPVMNWFQTRSEPDTEAEPRTLWGSLVQWFEETAAFWDGLGKEPKEGSIE